MNGNYHVAEVQDQHTVFLRVDSAPDVARRAGTASLRSRRVRLDYRSANDALYRPMRVTVTGLHVSANGKESEIQTSEDWLFDDIAKAPQWLRELVEAHAPAWNEEVAS